MQLRDFPEHYDIGRIDLFLKDPSVGTRKEFKNNRSKKFEWAVNKWDEIESLFDLGDSNQIEEKWLIPFFEQLDYQLIPYSNPKDNSDEENTFRNFRLDFQSKNLRNLAFKFVEISHDFDEKSNNNPQNLSHHDICQQFLNFNPDLHWIILTNGKQIRLITKYFYSFSKGFLQFNLEGIFTRRDLSEFLLLYNLLHITRFSSISSEIPNTNITVVESNRNEDENDLLSIDEENEDKSDDFETSIQVKTIIDLFLEISQKEGIKIGDSLRDNVHDAIELLGNELIQQNIPFLNKIKNDEINLKEYFSELLRIIYRIIFILYAEQRDMMPGSDSLYFRHFSLSSLRILAEKQLKFDKNLDIWRKIFLTFNLVKNGDSYLEVPCFNGKIFEDNFPQKQKIHPEGIPIIRGNNLSLSNHTVLQLIRLITTTKTGLFRQRINFREISEEEIGAIYESLLEYHPKLNSNIQFELKFETSERKSTGSYYTPKIAVQFMIKTALEPIISDIQVKYPNNIELENQILNLKICDPACGGGTFLLSAMDYLGALLARVRKNNNTPSDSELRNARREILQHCIYGVDKNPLAVELTKISLWLRACVNDRPLNYLDNHIKCGNSLIGLKFKSDKVQIKPEFFDILENSIEEKNRLKKIQKQIREEVKKTPTTKSKLVYLTSFIPNMTNSNLDTNQINEIFNMPERNAEELKKKEESYQKFNNTQKRLKMNQESDLITSVFFWSLNSESFEPYPNNTLIEEFKNGIWNDQIKRLIEKGSQISANYQFFHWFLEFPEIFNTENPGFDIIFANPPYISSKSIDSTLKNYFGNNYKTALKQYDLYSLFLEQCYFLLKSNRRFVLLIPDSFLGRSSFEKIRTFLLENSTIEKILQIQKLFLNISVSNVIISIKKEKPNNMHALDFARIKEIIELSFKDNQFGKINQAIITKFPNSKILFLDTVSSQILEKIKSKSIPFEDVIEIHRGEEIGKKSDIITNTPGSNKKKVLAGEDVQRYLTKFSEKYILEENVGKTDLYFKTKIVLRQLGNTINATLDLQGEYITLQSVYNITPKGLDIHYILAFLNSHLIHFYYTIFYKDKELFPRILLENVLQLPILIGSNEMINLICQNVKIILEKKRNKQDSREEEEKIDREICSLFNLDDKEMEYICQFGNKNNNKRN